MENNATVEMTEGPQAQQMPEEAAQLFNEVENSIEPEPGQEIPAPGQESDNPDIATADLIRPLINLGFATLAPAWEVTTQEQEHLVCAYAAVIDKYFPDGVKLGPEITAVMVTAAIVMPRIHKPRLIEPEGESNAAEA